MNWEVLIIPLIALGVWIIGTVFGKTDEPTLRRPARRRPEGQRSTGPATADLDRFLEEARRKREGKPSQPEPIPVAELVPQPRPIPPRPEPIRPTPTAERQPPKPREISQGLAQTRREQQRREEQRRDDQRREEQRREQPRPEQRREQMRPESAAPKSAARLPEPIQVVETVQAVATPATPPKVAAVATVNTTAYQPVSPIIAQVVTLLKKPQNAAAAFVLREILDKPLCHRRRT